jgi:hypothetical protein
MSDSDEEYVTAEESEVEVDEMLPVPTPPYIPGFVVWTSHDGTLWYLPRCEPDTVP